MFTSSHIRTWNDGLPVDTAATLRERAYRQIRRQIELGEMALGVRLSNRKLAQAMGMSPIPIREAITQLVSEGLLEQRPGIGTFVMNPTRHEIEDLYELREVLESYAARRAARVPGGRWLDEMRQSIDLMRQIHRRVEAAPMDQGLRDRLLEQWGLADATFHMAVLRRAGNQMAVKTVTSLRVMTRLFGRRAADERLRNLERIVREHTQILDSIEAGQVKEAATLMRAHIHRGRTIALRHDDSRRREDQDVKVSSEQLLADLHRQLSSLEGAGGDALAD